MGNTQNCLQGMGKQYVLNSTFRAVSVTNIKTKIHGLVEVGLGEMRKYSFFNSAESEEIEDDK